MRKKRRVTAKNNTLTSYRIRCILYLSTNNKEQIKMYISQEEKKEILTRVKPILKKHGIKGSFKVRNSSTLFLTLLKGPIDFKGTWNRNMDADPNQGVIMNTYRFEEAMTAYYGATDNYFTGECLDILEELRDEINKNNYDNSNLHEDYFKVGFGVEIKIGTYSRPYELTK